MNVWIVCHPDFAQRQFPAIQKTPKARRLAAIIRKVLKVNPKWITRQKDLNYLYEDVAPRPERYPDLILWTGRIGSRVMFDDGYGGYDRHYGGDGVIGNLETWIKEQVPDANPVYCRFSERAPRWWTQFQVFWLCSVLSIGETEPLERQVAT